MNKVKTYKAGSDELLEMLNWFFNAGRTSGQEEQFGQSFADAYFEYFHSKLKKGFSPSHTFDESEWDDEDDEPPTERQIEFATEIAQTLGIDIPERQTKWSFSDFIEENLKEFKKTKYEIRNSSGKVYQLDHHYSLGEGFMGDEKLNVNPSTV